MEEEPESPVTQPFDDGSALRNQVRASMEEFKNTVNAMRNAREEHREHKKQLSEHRKQQKRTEKLLSTKTEGLSKKPEFQATLPAQYSLFSELFSRVSFIAQGPLLELREREALIAPDRVYAKGIHWSPTDDVSSTQRHVLFEDTLKNGKGVRD